MIDQARLDQIRTIAENLDSKDSHLVFGMVAELLSHIDSLTTQLAERDARIEKGERLARAVWESSAAAFNQRDDYSTKGMAAFHALQNDRRLLRAWVKAKPSDIAAVMSKIPWPHSCENMADAKPSTEPPAEYIDLADVQDADFTSGLDPVEYINRLHAGNLAEPDVAPPAARDPAPNATAILEGDGIGDCTTQPEAVDFDPLGDNHHSAALCPYCAPILQVERDSIRDETLEVAASEIMRWARDVESSYGSYFYNRSAQIVRALKTKPAETGTPDWVTRWDHG